MDQPNVSMLHFSVFSCVADQSDYLMLFRENRNYSALKEMCVLVIFSVTMREYLDESNLREKVFYSGSQLRYNECITVGSSGSRRLRHITFTVRK